MDIKLFFKKIKSFGIKYTFCSYFLGRVRDSKLQERYYKSIYNYIDKNFKDIFVKYFIKEPKNEKSDNLNVWLYWDTGFINAPSVVQNCLKSVKKNLPDNAILHTLDYTTALELINIPKEIIDKHQKGIISKANFSDIIRTSLLYKYGGLWIDATVFLTDKIPFNVSKDCFITQKTFLTDKYKSISKGMWSSFFIGCTKFNSMVGFIRDSLIMFWEKNTIVINYVLIDFLIYYAYKNSAYVKNMIDSNTPNIKDIWFTLDNVNEKYSKELFDKIKENSYIHKLTYYTKNINEKTEDGVLTIYGKLLEDLKGNV